MASWRHLRQRRLFSLGCSMTAAVHGCPSAAAQCLTSGALLYFLPMARWWATTSLAIQRMMTSVNALVTWSVPTPRNLPDGEPRKRMSAIGMDQAQHSGDAKAHAPTARFVLIDWFYGAASKAGKCSG